MIKYSNILKLSNIPFEQYLKLDGLSHSTLKSMRNGVLPDFNVTDKVRVGKIVDDIHTAKWTDITHPLYKPARDIASCMESEIGKNVMDKLQYQNSYQSQIDANGLKMLVKGRPDAELGNLAVIDFKVTFQKYIRRKEDLIPLIKFMGYDNQIGNYANMSDKLKIGIKYGKFLFIHSVYANKTFFFKRLVDELDILMMENWWENKIYEYGTI